MSEFDDYIGICDFCNKENVVVTGTSFTSTYCRDCYKIVIEECREAVKEITKIEKSLRKTKK